MRITRATGRIAELGDSVKSSSGELSYTVYSHLDLEGGEAFARVRTLMGLDGKLRSAMRNGDRVELHFGSVDASGFTLLAMGMEDGPTFASKFPPPPMLLKLGPLCCLVLGFPLLPFFGIGLFMWWVAWKLHKGKSFLRAATKYIQDLPNARQL